MSRITQAYVADSIKFFKKDFLKMYGLSEYHDPNQPALFFGGRESSVLLAKHKSWKLILPSHPTDYPIINDYARTIFICSDNYKLPPGVIRKSLTPRIKDYSIFKPNPLGDKIYMYSGYREGWDIAMPSRGIVEELQKKIDFEIITTDHITMSDYYSIEDLKANFYDKSFLNLNFTPGRGLASVIELGLMGRKTVFCPRLVNNIQRVEFKDNFIHFQTWEDLLSIINSESKKIGTTQPSIDAHNIDDEWLDLDFWL